MRYATLVMVITSIVLFNWNTAWTESTGPREKPQGNDGPGQHERHKEGPDGKRHRGGPPRMGLLGLIDTNRDGTLSADEIADSPTALKQLDKNDDGEVTREEFRHHFRSRMEEQGRRGSRGLRSRDQGGPEGRSERFFDHVMSHDENDDGKVEASEMPERMQRLLDHADANGDGALDRPELEAAAAKKRERREQHRRSRQGEGKREPRDQ